MWRLQQLLRKIPFQWNLLRQNLRARRLRVRWQALVHRLPRTPEGEALLHIGCGDINARHFINIDARDKPHVHIVTKDLFKLDLIPSGFADLIYMSHVLEHVGHRSVVSVLKEMRRILKPGGVLRISVPDFE